MTPERWRRIEDLYHRASEQPVAARRAFVEAACADDHDLRREVDALLGRSLPALRGEHLHRIDR